MLGHWRIILVVSCFTVAACATAHDAGERTDGGTPRITFVQLKAAPASFKGQSLVFGGEVLTAKRLKDGTRIEILQPPLDESSRPGLSLTQSQGRFIAIHRDFLDPATLPYGTRVTVTGDVTGSITMPLDETDYTYPSVEIKNLQVWAGIDEAAPPYAALSLWPWVLLGSLLAPLVLLVKPIPAAMGRRKTRPRAPSSRNTRPSHVIIVPLNL
jgi:outer membrane lipoprotein